MQLAAQLLAVIDYSAATLRSHGAQPTMLVLGTDLFGNLEDSPDGDVFGISQLRDQDLPPLLIRGLGVSVSYNVPPGEFLVCDDETYLRIMGGGGA